MSEQGVVFNSNGKQLVAIEHLPELVEQEKPKKGMIIVVGGPQTRVGSHRLFVYLARTLAKKGVTVFRFDYSGAGDSEGTVSTFSDIQDDIDAAIKTFQLRHSDITDLALWGLCDAASAILLYLSEKPEQAKIKRIFLVNPWVRQAQTQAKAYLRGYYIKRFLSKNFWQKLLAGKIKTKSTLSDIQKLHQQSQTNNISNKQGNFVTEMLRGLNQFSGTCDILLSGNDLTADEFKLLIKIDKHWRHAMARATINKQTIDHTDHTFSHRDKQIELIRLVCNAFAK
ncbi:hydrolase 1, exosortase A system-associated [Colwellia psychrerythraea]|uniref:Hydrolase, exosortase system type 1 associated protein n=1 Tax=Colwellia psychrerythraea TaxID=28229 RepID=A0A099KSV1_COLPS|nr:hydrolase 1, exosortase A system-associated [Colwellia psychrerythraea]KGJ92728.1 hydrolase, exosortase system type 1 associated protein [Colwellia psychrerythraea]